MSPNYGGEQTYRETLRDLNQVRQWMQENPDLSTDVQGAMRDLQRLYYGNDAELAGRLSRQFLPELERLELEIRRKLEANGDQVRSAGSETIPNGYADAVAEYFRRLSKTK